MSQLFLLALAAVLGPRGPTCEAAPPPLLRGAAAVGGGGVMAVSPFTYGHVGKDGPPRWARLSKEYAACGSGKWGAQSPIDIPAAALPLPKGGLGDLIFPPASGAATFNVTQSHGPKFSCPRAGGCGGLAKGLHLAQFHFHSPSEHTVNGMRFPLEMHMVHCGGGDCAAGPLAVVSVLFRHGGGAGGAAAAALSRLWESIAEAGGAPTGPVRLSDLYSGASGYYEYSGSLTTPPCSEPVRWYVQDEPVLILAEQSAALFEQVGGYPGNSRPTQPRNGRAIVPH